MFPEKWTLDDLAQMRMGDPVLFASNYMLAPSDDVTSTFKESWLTFYEWMEPNKTIKWVDGSGVAKIIPISSLDVVILCDPGGFAKKGMSDDRMRSAIVVTGTTDEGQCFILDTWSERDTYMEAQRQMVNLARLFKARKIAIERAGQQAPFIDGVRRMLRDAIPPVMVSVEEVSPGGKDKDARILMLEPYFQRGKIAVGKGHETQEFRDQYQLFPRSSRRDILDALAYYPYVARTPTLGAKTGADRQQAEINALRTRMGYRRAVQPGGRR